MTYDDVKLPGTGCDALLLMTFDTPSHCFCCWITLSGAILGEDLEAELGVLTEKEPTDPILPPLDLWFTVIEESILEAGEDPE
jgi:hypothetical protein